MHATRRPCLKHGLSAPTLAEATRNHPASRVHFPPTPALSTTFPTHSKATYDRRPVIVVPNDCALPARGSPGRTYVLERTHSSPLLGRTDDHPEDSQHYLDQLPFPPSPRTISVSILAPGPPSAKTVPGLVRDHASSSSESESDGIIASPPEDGLQQSQADGMSYLPCPSFEREKEREERRRRRKEALDRASRKRDIPVVNDLSGGVLGGF